MPFSVTSYIADSKETIITANWAYTNDDGRIANRIVFAQPAGDTPLSEVTPEVISEWVEDQLENSTEDFDKAIANAKANSEYQSQCKQYNLDEDNTFKVVVPETTAS